MIKIAIEPKTKADIQKMGVGLNKLAQEDPSFSYSRDDETNQTVIEGMGELHLEIIVDRLRREFKVDCDVGAPQVNYRERLSKAVEIQYTHKKQSGGSGQYADVSIKVSSLASPRRTVQRVRKLANRTLEGWGSRHEMALGRWRPPRRSRRAGSPRHALSIVLEGVGGRRLRELLSRPTRPILNLSRCCAPPLAPSRCSPTLGRQLKHVHTQPLPPNPR